MRTSWSLTVAITAASLLVASATAAAADSTGGAQVPQVSVVYSVGDVQYDGAGCVDVPVTLNYQKTGSADLIQAIVTIGLTYGDQPIEAPGTDYLAPEAPATTTQTTSAAFCTPSITDDAGPLLVKGTIQGGSVLEDDQKADLSPSPANVIKNPTTMSQMRATRSGKNVRLDGLALATTITHGKTGPEGLVQVEAKAAKAKTWAAVGTTYVNTSGKWTTLARAPHGKSFAKGTVFRANLTGCGWCTDATISTVLR